MEDKVNKFYVNIWFYFINFIATETNPSEEKRNKWRGDKKNKD